MDLSTNELMFLNCGVGEDTWESLRLQGDPHSPFWRKSVLNIHWKDWCWSWNSNPLASWCEELTHWKRRWCWERLKAGRERDVYSTVETRVDVCYLKKKDASWLTLLSASPAFNLSQHQGLFKWVSSLHQVAKIVEFQFQHQSLQWIFRTDLL